MSTVVDSPVLSTDDRHHHQRLHEGHWDASSFRGDAGPRPARALVVYPAIPIHPGAAVVTAGGENSRLFRDHNGYLLIEAPTGSGKTLIAGTIVERFSQQEDVVWFWFAPFKGVVGQTAAFLREQFHGLRLRELADDRAAAMSRGGDDFVTTWQTVATRVKDKRNVRKEGETNPSTI